MPDTTTDSGFGGFFDFLGDKLNAAADIGLDYIKKASDSSFWEEEANALRDMIGLRQDIANGTGSGVGGSGAAAGGSPGLLSDPTTKAVVTVALIVGGGALLIWALKD